MKLYKDIVFYLFIVDRVFIFKNSVTMKYELFNNISIIDLIDENI